MRSLRTALMLVVLLLGALTASAGAAPVRDSALDVNSCGVDEFEGTALDTARWTTVRGTPTVGGIARAEGDPSQIAIDFRMMRGHHGLERLLPHVPLFAC